MKSLQKQLGLIEGEVKEIQIELAAIKKNRKDLNVQKESPRGVEPEEGDTADVLLKDNVGVHQDAEIINTSEVEAQELRLRRAGEARLRARTAAPAGPLPASLETRKSTAKEVTALKNKVMELEGEVEELKIGATEKGEQLEEYRAKYLQAQQHAEELQRQLDLTEFENRQVSDQIQADIQKMKVHFQTKLQDLAPLPELLAGARERLREARRLQALAEDTAGALAADVRLVNDKLLVAVNSLNQERAARAQQADELQRLQLQLADQRADTDQLTTTLDDYKCLVVRLEERLAQEEARGVERAAEGARLAQELEALRAERPRVLARARQRALDERVGLRTQLAELERQLAVARAHARSCQKDRDEVRQRMQAQLGSLQECFQVSQVGLRALQTQVDALKHSYALVLADHDD